MPASDRPRRSAADDEPEEEEENRRPVRAARGARRRIVESDGDDDDFDAPSIDDDDDDGDEEAPLPTRRLKRGRANDDEDGEDDGEEAPLRRPKRGRADDAVPEAAAAEDPPAEEAPPAPEAPPPAAEAEAAAARPAAAAPEDEEDEEDESDDMAVDRAALLQPATRWPSDDEAPRRREDSPGSEEFEPEDSSEGDDDDDEESSSDGVRRRLPPRRAARRRTRNSRRARSPSSSVERYPRRERRPARPINVSGLSPNQGLAGAPPPRGRRGRDGGDDWRYKSDSDGGGGGRVGGYAPSPPRRPPRRRRPPPPPLFDSDDSSVARRGADQLSRRRSLPPPKHDLDLSSSSDEDAAAAGAAGPAPAVAPFQGVAGLDHHLKALEEMVLLPLKEPNLFKSLGITPPRGVLFHGPPGTGKTLVARQLARACSAHLVKNRPHDDRAEAKRSGVAFFVRNGADCLSKYVGEAEKALGSLFDEAKAKAPSIIFFDELDGLAPARAAGRGGSGELAQHSVVATLLALMDGLADRGDVVVIGATNRPDALDPALRRPGRFDRELQFCAPDETQRRAILALHTESWAPSSKPTPQLLSALAARTAGFCGADLRALCTEAALAAVRRARPDLYENTPGSRTAVVVSARDFEAAARKAAPAALRRSDLDVDACAPQALAPHRAPLYQASVDEALRALGARPPPAAAEPTGASAAFAAAISARRAPRKALAPFAAPASLVLAAADGARSRDVVLAAVAHAFKARGAGVAECGYATLLRDAARTGLPLDACLAARARDARRTAAPHADAVLVVQDVDGWSARAPDPLHLAFAAILNELRRDQRLVVVATAADAAAPRPAWLADAALVVVPPASPAARVAFWTAGLLDVKAAFRAALEALAAPAPPAAEAPAAPPAPAPPKAVVAKRDDAKARHCWRELRVFLRACLRELRSDRALAPLWRPVDPEEQPEYLAVVAEPLDLGVVRARVDAARYKTLGAFLEDVGRVRTNAARLRAAFPGDARADDLSHAAHNAEDLCRSMAHAFRRKLGWDLVAACDRLEKRSLRRDRRAARAAVDAALAARAAPPDTPEQPPPPPVVGEDSSPDPTDADGPRPRKNEADAVERASQSFAAAVDALQPRLEAATAACDGAVLERRLDGLFDAVASIDDGAPDDLPGVAAAAAERVRRAAGEDAGDR